MSETKTSPAVEEYLEVIYRLTEKGDPAPLTLLAERLAISSVSANEMVRKLAERGLVTYEPYKGVSLTPSGRQQAQSMLRRHRLWERFLTDILGFPWSQVHEEACRLEHATSNLLEEYLTAYLSQPSSCPHGIPFPGGESSLEESVTLAELPAKQSGRVVAVMNEDAAFLSALERAGLKPGAWVEMAQVEPAMHSVTVRIAGERSTIAEAVAAQIRVIPSSDLSQKENDAK